MIDGPKPCVVTETVRVPEPVYDRLSREAETQDVPRGAIVRDWMEKADKYATMEEHRR